MKTRYAGPQTGLGWIPKARLTRYRFADQRGFSTVELLVVLIITLLIAAYAIPSLLSAVNTSHLRGAASDYAGLLEVARISAIRDNTFYATYVLAPATGAAEGQAYVDLPQGGPPPAKNNGASVQAGDPAVTIPSDVLVQSQGSAPNTSDLKSQLYPSTTVVPPTDTSVTPATFGPRGLPCTPLTLTGTTSVVCDTSGGPTAFWTFFQDTRTGTWQAVTITPAGRIKRWFYNSTAWAKL
jgi:Tfp pilus assembly protein FimT